jgi:sensor histidine kinase YesM
MQIDDRRARLLGIPAFGTAIPFAFDLYGDLGARDALAWLGAALFLALSFAIWHGNRWLLFRSRTARAWLDAPVRRVVLLVAGIVLFTAPLTVCTMLAWSWLSGVHVDVRAVALVNVICVVFVAHVYETVLLIKERESDVVRVEKTERARAEAELLALRRQVDPHFIFNCLNTLQHLIDEDPARAKRFNQDFAAMTRYLLATSDRRTVPLEDEIAFVRRYAALLAIRFGDAFTLEITDHRDASSAPLDAAATALPPTALQLLVENAAKHNAFHARAPLVVRVDVFDDRVVVENARAPREGVAGAGAGLGLRNLAERVLLACGRALTVDDDGARFRVTVPLFHAAIQPVNA